MIFSLEHLFTKRRFDPANRDDLLAYKKYLTTGAWGKGGCPFKLEQGWTSIPQMCTVKLATWAVKNAIKR